MWKVIRRLIILGLYMLFCLAFLAQVPAMTTCGDRYGESDVIPDADFAIVFGAGYMRDGGLYPVTRHRVEAAVQLYKAGRVKQILISGDNSLRQYNEPLAMIRHAIQMGVDPEDICADYAGRSTYDTCF